MHSVTSSEHSGLVGMVGPCAKNMVVMYWWRCIVNNESVRRLRAACLAGH